MKQFIKENFTLIVFILLILSFLKGCNDSRELTKVKSEMKSLRDSVATKSEVRALNYEVDNMRQTLWGFMDSYNFLLDKFTDSSIKNKANDKAWSIVKQHETLDK